MNLSKSKYCQGLQCKKMLWLAKNKPNEGEDTNNNAILEQGNLVHEVARYLYGEHINIEYTDNLNEMIKDTYRTIESYKDAIITEASFRYEKNFCSVDILKKKGDSYEIYEVKSSTALKDVYINDASYQYYILSSLGFKVNKCGVITINNKYERIGKLDLNELFLINDITDTVISLQPKVEKSIEAINHYMESEIEPTESITENCFKPYACPFFKYCTKHLPTPNVFDITLNPGLTGLKFYQKGIYSFEDLLKSSINNKQRQRIEFELYDKPDYIDKKNLKKFLKTLSYPLYFLDFETYQMPIPLYDRVHPYEQVPFQYSLHYLEKEDRELKHLEFLAPSGTDPREALAKRLVKDIPLDVCTLAYNMKFEKSVIKRLAELYPELSSHLMNIHDNIKDLIIPFDKRYYYSKNMHGSSSIKHVLPALFPNTPELDYHNLDLIQNGSDAMNSFRSLENMSETEQKYTRERLLKYCELDTYAMVKIYKKIKEVIK